MKDLSKIPDPLLHRNISFVKSILRIAAGVALIIHSAPSAIAIAGGLLIAAEILGIAEELV
jgi:hypothetical protein